MALNYTSTQSTSTAATVTPTTLMTVCFWMHHVAAFSGTMRICDMSRFTVLPTGAADDIEFHREFTGGLSQYTVTLLSNGIDKNNWSFHAITHDANDPTNDPVWYCAQEGDSDLTTVSFSGTSETTGTVVNTATTLYIGNRSDGLRPFGGALAWFTLYNDILTKDQCLEVARNGSISTSLLRGYELISTTGASSEQDLSSNNADATPNNTPTKFDSPPQLIQTPRLLAAVP